jgi:hypothetical protein
LRPPSATSSSGPTSGARVTLVGALALRGWVAALSFSGSLDREAFGDEGVELLVPRLRRTDVMLLATSCGSLCGLVRSRC